MALERGLRDLGLGRPAAVTSPDDIVHLSAGGARMDIAPNFGGAVLRYEQDGAAVLSAVQYDASRAGAASFAMVPWVSRIADGRFAFAGRKADLKPNLHGDPHPAHGLGWTSAWRVAAQTADALTLVHDHDGEGWPWRYRATQEIRLARDRAEFHLTLQNKDDSAMPAALGFHPYFPRVETPRVWTSVAAKLLLDEAGLPSGREAWRADGPLAADGLDALFAGWSREARFERPSGGFIRLIASEACGHLIVYCPKGGDFLCVEPVSTNADAMNQPAPEGLVTLQPSERMQATMTLRLET